MKKNSLVLLALIFVFSACTPAETETVMSVTPTISPTATYTSTPSITPLPTIPTFTPTFDVSTIVTVTPAEKAECPKEKAVEKYDFEFLNLAVGLDTENRAHAEDNILKFLNMYGAQPLVKHLKNNWGFGLYEDLTNDNVPELAIGLTSFFIFGCKNGHYEKILELPPDGYLIPPSILFSEDNNKNGLLELTMLIETQSQGARSYQIYEWGETQFTNLIPPNDINYSNYADIYIQTTGSIYYEDVNKDSIKELIVDSGIPLWTTYPDGLPWRNKRTYFQWNGQYYSPALFEFDHPEFRFQAIQDGDLSTNQSELDKALFLYQDAIFDNTLKDYSREIRINLQENWYSGLGDIKPTPTTVAPYPAEYPSLASYAHYRIMLLQFVQGQETEANQTYQTLQDTFGNDAYAKPYIEMATGFLQAYQVNQSMYAGCAAAIQYAVEHPEILTPLGSDYHGWQAKIYEPEDVCPFR